MRCPSPLRTPACWLAAVALALLSAVLGAPPAQAHASLVASAPSDGSQLTREPTTVQLDFSENVAEPAFVVVTAPDGTEVSVGDPVVLDDRVTQELAPNAYAGTYTLAFRVASSDGHPVSDELTFEVTKGRPAPPGAAPAAEDGQSFWTGHWPHVIIAGGGALIAFVIAPRLRRA